VEKMSLGAPANIASSPPMGELNVSNGLLGDPAALRVAWDRDGYWFFRDVLDKDVIAEIRAKYMRYLADYGAVDLADPQARCLGGDLDALRKITNDSRLNREKTHRLLHEAPTINAFFRRLFGSEPFWIPFTVHRATPPAAERSGSRFEFIHADGIYNEGLDFLICWVPLAEIDAEIGGIAVVEGVHKQPTLHRKQNMKIIPIQEEDVPAAAWKRAVYRPGDVLLMSLDTPHSGIANHSDRFRLSMDTRVMPSSGRCPIVGEVTAVDAEGVSVRDGLGERRFRFTAESFVRGTQGDQMPVADVPARYRAGDEVILAHDGDLVVNMRPQT